MAEPQRDDDQDLRMLQKQNDTTDEHMREATHIVMTSQSGKPSKELQAYFEKQGLSKNHGEAWCAETAGAIQKSLGRQIPGPDKEGSSYPLARRWAESWGTKTNIPHVGDVIATGGLKGGHGHIRTVTEVGPQGEITTIEGNAGKGVGRVGHYKDMEAALHPADERTGAVDKRPYVMKTATAKELAPGTLGEPSFARRAQPVEQANPFPHDRHDTKESSGTPSAPIQTTNLMRKGSTPNMSNPANPYFNTHEHEYAVVTDHGANDKTKQGRVTISPQSLAGVDPQMLPKLKMHTADNQTKHTWNSQHNFKNGNIVKVRKDPHSGEWELIGGNPGQIGGIT